MKFTITRDKPPFPFWNRNKFCPPPFDVSWNTTGDWNREYKPWIGRVKKYYPLLYFWKISFFPHYYRQKAGAWSIFRKNMVIPVENLYIHTLLSKFYDSWAPKFQNVKFLKFLKFFMTRMYHYRETFLASDTYDSNEICHKFCHLPFEVGSRFTPGDNCGNNKH